MPQYTDPIKIYSMDHPEGWLPLTEEGSPHVSFASLTTGGYLKIEAFQFNNPSTESMQPTKKLRALVECDLQRWKTLPDPLIQLSYQHGTQVAYTTYTRREDSTPENVSDFGHTRAWVFTRGTVQVCCLYRCRSDDAGVDDEELDGIIDSLELFDEPHLDAAAFSSYYYSLLKRHRPQLVPKPPEGLALTLSDGQTVLLEHLYNHYLLEPQRMDELIEMHMDRLDYCGDDVPDLANYEAIRSLLFPKIFASGKKKQPSHRQAFWPGLAVGAVVQGSVFTYGVNAERLRTWGFKSIDGIMEQLIDNLYGVPPISPRGLRDEDGGTEAISYVDHPFSASFILFQDFYHTTAHNLGSDEFLVGMPDPSCVSCFRDTDPRFVVQHTALLRWDYHRSVERLTDTIYLVTGPSIKDVKPYDVLHCCPKTA